MKGNGLFGSRPSVIFSAVILLLFAYVIVAAHNDKSIRAQVDIEMAAKRQAEIEMGFKTITRADWRIIKGEWTKESVCYIIKSESVDHPFLFRNLPPDMEIGEKVKLERKQGAIKPWRANSYNIISNEY